MLQLWQWIQRISMVIKPWITRGFVCGGFMARTVVVLRKDDAAEDAAEGGARVVDVAIESVRLLLSM
jgi:hypothetical protein